MPVSPKSSAWQSPTRPRAAVEEHRRRLFYDLVGAQQERFRYLEANIIEVDHGCTSGLARDDAAA
jgi:hypothetical protein